jgi:redox-sensitive bicupin YhaK (pirin superfamily)
MAAWTATIHPDIPTSLLSRRVERTVRGRPASDGDGVRLVRVLGNDLQRRLDPFLMLDHFGSDDASDYIGGFPSHPHRGFETVTLMQQGRMRHQDSAGNVGLLEPGSVQWMTAGRGIIHSEMPEQEEGRMAGFQLWVNLPAKTKMQAPAYRDIAPESVPVVSNGAGATLRLVAGRALGAAGAVQRPDTEPLVADVSLEAGAVLDLEIPTTHNAFVFVHEGSVAVGPVDGATTVPAGTMAILGNEEAAGGVRLRADGSAPAGVLVVAGRPLREPIAQMGPFVMNSEAELRQAVHDFRSGALAT